MSTSLNDHQRVVRKDEILFKEGEKATHLILVQSGGILCLKKSKERLIPVFFGDEQKLIGEEAVMTGTPHNYSAVATQDSEVIQIEASMIKNVMETAPEWIRDLFGTLGERASGTASAIAEHRLTHSELSGGQDLAPQEETRLKKLLGQ